MIVRVFTVTVREGQEEAFSSFFLRTAVPLVRSQEGLVSMIVGLPLETTPLDFSMVTVWRDLDALKGFAGEQWREAVIHADEKHLIANASVSHYYHEGTD